MDWYLRVVWGCVLGLLVVWIVARICVRTYFAEKRRSLMEYLTQKEHR
jgi:hypothetical protein